ncbi:Phosphatidic acid phosphatase type 2/haloperoxidase domain-containing protein [Plasmodiophora brassicae]|uniref:Phosphatidic acid phosphatase type 2/haloperoxidase domain-containing protein n=1 Tax=Plasmodiophora brassicae TaxID=37360 RepID=A0A3P3YKW1_PLABS|nr:unnamed protein product [Plasmodiophora brassicae]
MRNVQLGIVAAALMMAAACNAMHAGSSTADHVSVNVSSLQTRDAQEQPVHLLSPSFSSTITKFVYKSGRTLAPPLSWLINCRNDDGRIVRVRFRDAFHDEPSRADVAGITFAAYLAESLVLVIYQLPLNVLSAAIGGVAVQSLRAREYGNEAADNDNAVRPAIVLTLTAAGASFLPQVIAIYVIVTLAVRFRVRASHWAYTTVSMLARVAGCCLSGIAASGHAGQDVVIGAKCGSVYGAAVVLSDLWVRHAIPHDGPRSSCWMLNPLTWVDLGMCSSSIWAAILALFVSVPGYSHNLFGTGALMGLFGMGDIASVADKFPAPGPPSAK